MTPYNGEGIAYTALAATAQETLALCEAAVRTSRVPLTFSHVTALQLLGIEPPLHCGLDDSLLHVVVQDQRQRHSTAGIQRHLWRNDFHLLHLSESVECVNALTAWAQMSPFLNLGELIVLGDSLLRRNPLLKQCDIADFAGFLRATNAFRGKAKCQKAVRFIPEGTDSSWETRIRLVLRQYGLPEAIPNFAVYDKNLGCYLHINLAYPDCKVGIEFQGDHHRTSKGQYAFDQKKKRHLEHQGWRIIPVVAADIATESLRLELARIIAKAIGRQMPTAALPRYRELCEI
ncbi:hypothetical protein CS006_04295 [Bifidobacterium primatium]|uniref:DUF559 domain-containing protein n=1 Tax=Bifidobacterium primatium TaxID=2045438 RepID=A0A2M9H8Y8_9BIFI|nr:hypothetical protein [Bifidobacterium primatium]PJM73274.1 hypothetical protein CS006_04295 [Bifidobacterium primatium]